ncbi:MAG TPA: hypothetical protein VN736_01145 [Candidatus Limnocylindrales bacterium]|nr:hypothetical protein [Candidatus Limnocylindrales bacterium]
MSVLVSDARNAAYTGSLGTTNGLVKADTFNLMAQGTSLALSSTQTIAFTPTTGYNNNGVILCLVGTATFDRSITASLQQFVSGAWTTVASQTLTAATICNGITNKQGNWIVPFKWTGVAVTAAASTWRYSVVQSGGTTGTFNLATSDGINGFYVALSDTQATFTSNQDQVIFMDAVNIDGNYILKRNSSTVQICGIVCKSSSAPTYSNDVGNLTWFSPAASYELGIDGGLVLSAHGALRIGKSTSVIPVAQKAVLNFNYLSSGTLKSGLYGVILGGGGADSKPSIFCFGTTVTNQYATLSADAASGATTATTTSNLSSWPTSAQLGPSGVTITIASPGVATTPTPHCLQSGDQIIFTTTGALPTGITAGTIYYVSATGLTQTQFQFSATSGGASVITTGSQSGTHTLSTATRVYLGKQNVQGQGSTAYNALRTAVFASGTTTLTFNEAIATNTRKGPINGAPGGVIINIDGYSIVMKGGSTGGVNLIQIEGVSNLYFQGVQFQEVQFSTQSFGSGLLGSDDTANLTQWTWNNCLFIQRVTPTFFTYSCFANLASNLNPFGTLVQNTAFINAPLGSIVPLGGVAPTGLNVTTCWVLNGAGNDNGLITLNTSAVFTSVVVENTLDEIVVPAYNATVQNCRFWGCSQSFDGLFNLGTALAAASGLTFQNNTYNNCTIPIEFNAAYATFKNESFGNEVANTVDMRSNRTSNLGAPNIVIDTPLTAVNIPNNVFSGSTATNPSGSYIRILNEANVVNSNRSFYPNGYYTTPDKASLLGKTFLNGVTSTFNTLSTTFYNYTRSVSGFTLGAQVTAQIANAAYYTGGSGVVMPKLDVYADGATNPVATVSASSGTSSQTLSTSYVFTTNNNNLNVVLSQKPTSTCTEANSGVTWSNLIFNVRQYGYQYQTYTTTVFQSTDTIQQALNTPVTNSFLTDAVLGPISSATAQSYGSSLSYDGTTITQTGNLPVTQVYAYFQWWAAQTANVNTAVPFTTIDGNNFTCSANYVLSNATLTGNGAQKLITLGSFVFTNSNGQLQNVTVSDANGTHITIALSGLVSGSTVELYDTATSTELYNAVVNSTTLNYYALYTGSADTIRIRVRKADYLPFETSTVLSASSVNIVVSQSANPIYAQTGIDGSTVTEFSFSGSQVKIFVTGTSTTVQRLIAWYLWTISTTAYIGLQPSDITLPSSTWAQFIGGMTIKNQNSTPVVVSGGNITDGSNSATAVIDTSGGPIFIVSASPAANATDMASSVWASTPALTVNKYLALK